MEKCKIKLFVGTPMHGGICYGSYANSCLNLLYMLQNVGIEVLFYFLYDDPLVPRARDTIVHEFRKSDCTHLLFIDADIEFSPQHVLDLLNQNQDIIGGPYAKKNINWEKVASAVRNMPDIKPEDLYRLGGDYVYYSEECVKDSSKLWEVTEMGTGFMLIRRNVFTTFMERYPELRYTNEQGEEMFSFFPTFIDKKGSITNNGTNRYLSEDYAFCSLWRKLGGKIMLAPWIMLKHIGNYSYISDLSFSSESYLKK